MTDVERIAVLEHQVKELTEKLRKQGETVDLLAEHCPDRNDLQKRFQIISKTIIELASSGSQRSLFDQIFGSW